MRNERESFNSPYTGKLLEHLAYPMGGMGAGMLCLEGAGALSHVSVRGEAAVNNEPLMFAALAVKDEGPDGAAIARVLEGPVPTWKIYSQRNAGNGLGGTDYGLPRFAAATFEARFPFGIVELQDESVPLRAQITGWSPFIPGDPDSAGLPVAGLEYRFHNPTDRTVEAVFSFHARNFMSTGTEGEAVKSVENGFVLWQPAGEETPEDQGAFSAVVDEPEVAVNCALFRGGWFDALTMVWKSVEEADVIASPPPSEGAPSPGASLYVPVRLAPGEEKTIHLRLAWHVPETGLRLGDESEEACCEGSCDCEPGTYQPWYTSVFDDIEAVNAYWRKHYDDLREKTQTFTNTFYDTTLPPEVVEAVAANLVILKSPTVQRQADGRLWCWEGCHDNSGCCRGSCTHVWNYAQAIPHLFPSLERSLRETEFFVDQNAAGHQAFRASLPIRPPEHTFHAASDGQLGGIMKVYREWRISGDEMWLRRFWPRVKASLDYCIETWDPEHRGVLVEPHHNTYDIEFWGPDGMCSSFYLGALKAATVMTEALDDDVPLYRELLERGVAYMEAELWDGEYFIQKIQWEGLHAEDPTKSHAWNVDYSPEAAELLQEEGPKYQYGKGCISDGVLGAWIAAVCGVPDFLDREKVTGHLLAVHKHNLKRDLLNHANPQRPTFALGDDGGLLLCTWPKGGELSLPFVYSNEVWTGIEYQVASHLMLMGRPDEGCEIVRIVRDRYDSSVRDPFDEYECGHWYARAMASYGLIQGLTGVRYDAVDKVLYIAPTIEGDFRAFTSTATGYGTVGIKDGEPFVEVVHGTIPYEEIVYTPYE
jgi:uncharacterized protein (DUF608 family)